MIHLKKTWLLSAALVALSAVPSFSADLVHTKAYHPYIGLFGGLDFLPNIAATDPFGFPPFIPILGPGSVHSKVGDFAGAVIGVDLNDSWRVEAELSRSFNGIENFTFNNGNVNTYSSGGINQTYALANAWYGFRNQSAFVPYLGGGFGLGWADGNLGSAARATAPAALAFQVGAGVTYKISDRFSIDVGYRFKAMTGLNATVTTSSGSPAHLDQTTIGSHNFQIGATLRF